MFWKMHGVALTLPPVVDGVPEAGAVGVVGVVDGVFCALLLDADVFEDEFVEEFSFFMLSRSSSSFVVEVVVCG